MMVPQWGTHQTVHLPSQLPQHEYLKVCGGGAWELNLLSCYPNGWHLSADRLNSSLLFACRRWNP